MIVDIGFGDGELLVATAEDHAESNFIGIEVYDAGIGHCLKLIEQRKVNNLKLISGDAVEVMKFGIPNSSINQINLFFPDPWPKKKHHRRRFVTQEFLRPLHNSMKAGSILRIATDIEDYVRQTLQEAPKAGFRWIAKDASDWRSPWCDWISTRYELKALKEGRVPHYLTFVA